MLFFYCAFQYTCFEDWPQIQGILGRFGRESIRRRCYELNPLGIPVDKAREAKDILKHYDLLRVSEISVGLSAFFNWVSYVKNTRFCNDKNMISCFVFI